MTSKKTVLLAFVAIINFLLFQNCSGSHFSSPSLSDSHSKSLVSDSTGQPYDGKVYVTAGSCPDGTYVKTRVVIKSAAAGTVVREDCNDADRVLGAGEFTLNAADPNKIEYRGQTLNKEVPWTPIPIFTTWYLQLQGALLNQNARIYDIDMFDTTDTQIASLKQAGHVVICNFSAGTYENWRGDAASFSANDLGNNVSGNAGEKWLDIRSPSVRALMVARMDLAQKKGCDGVDLDSADGYANATGFALTSSEQITYNEFLAFAGHDRRLIVAMKNNADLASTLVNTFDFAIAEQCLQYNECAKYSPFTLQGKAVLGAEFTPISPAKCSAAHAASVSSIFVNHALDGTAYETCP